MCLNVALPLLPYGYVQNLIKKIPQKKPKTSFFCLFLNFAPPLLPDAGNLIQKILNVAPPLLPYVRNSIQKIPQKAKYHFFCLFPNVWNPSPGGVWVETFFFLETSLQEVSAMRLLLFFFGTSLQEVYATILFVVFLEPLSRRCRSRDFPFFSEPLSRRCLRRDFCFSFFLEHLSRFMSEPLLYWLFFLLWFRISLSRARLGRLVSRPPIVLRLEATARPELAADIRPLARGRNPHEVIFFFHHPPRLWDTQTLPPQTPRVTTPTSLTRNPPNTPTPQPLTLNLTLNLTLTLTLPTPPHPKTATFPPESSERGRDLEKSRAPSPPQAPPGSSPLWHSLEQCKVQSFSLNLPPMCHNPISPCFTPHFPHMKKKLSKAMHGSEASPPFTPHVSHPILPTYRLQ